MAGARGKQVGPWTLGEQLGRGGNATAWVATRGNDDESVALKVINATKVQVFSARSCWLVKPVRRRRPGSRHAEDRQVTQRAWSPR